MERLDQQISGKVSYAILSFRRFSPHGEHSAAVAAGRLSDKPNFEACQLDIDAEELRLVP